MSSNYTRREVPTKRLKQTAHCVCSSCTSHPLSPSLAAVFIFLFDTSICPQLCVFTCVHYYRCVTTHAHGCRCVCVSATLAFCRTVSGSLDILRLFFIVTVFANVCDRLSEKSQRLSMFGVTGRSTVCVRTDLDSSLLSTPHW